MEKIPSVMRPPPTYSIPFPNNIHSINDENERKTINLENDHIDFWTDGSCLPNAGPVQCSNCAAGCAAAPLNFSAAPLSFLMKTARRWRTECC